MRAMVLLRRRRVVVAVIITCWALAAAADDGAALLQYLAGLHAYSAKFTQQRFDETGELIETAHGNCNIERPGRFRWLYQDPYQQTIVSDGQQLWVYDQDLAQVTVNPVDPNRQGTPAELLSAEFDVASRYIVTALGAKDGYDWYRLTPKGPVGEFQDIELGMATGAVAAMRLRDNLGQTTLLQFTAVRRNEAQDAALFTFTPPANIDVIKGGAP